MTSRTAVIVRKDRCVPTSEFGSGTFTTTCSIRAFQNPTKKSCHQIGFELNGVVIHAEDNSFTTTEIASERGDHTHDINNQQVARFLFAFKSRRKREACLHYW